MYNISFEKEIKAFGKAVRRLRDERDLNQEEVCSRTGIVRSSLVEIEQGKRFPQGLNILRLSLALGVTPAYLMEQAFPDWEKTVEMYNEANSSIFSEKKLAQLRNPTIATGARGQDRRNVKSF